MSETQNPQEWFIIYQFINESFVHLKNKHYTVPGSKPKQMKQEKQNHFSSSACGI